MTLLERRHEVAKPDLGIDLRQELLGSRLIKIAIAADDGQLRHARLDFILESIPYPGADFGLPVELARSISVHHQTDLPRELDSAGISPLEWHLQPLSGLSWRDDSRGNGCHRGAPKRR